jgi:integrase
MRPLTDITINNLKPRAEQFETADSGARGLRVVTYPSGRKSFIVRYRNAAGRTRKHTLPAGITLAAARKLTGDLMLEVAQGRDPGTTKKQAKSTARSRADDTVERLAVLFVEQHAKRKTRANSWRATVGIFNNIILPAWGSRNVHEIARRDAIELLEDVAVDRPIMANRTHAVLSKFFKWLCERDVITASPMTGVSLPSKETARERTLDDDELRRLWLAAEAIGGPAGACVKLLMLTGQRKNEIARLTWGEVGGDVLEIPASRMKGRKAHTLPLSTQALDIIASMPKLTPQVPRSKDYVFGPSPSGRSPIGHFDRVKRELDKHMAGVPHWTIHDIRRSTATGLARIGTALPTIEKILAHTKGSFAGVVATYQRHSFVEEMRIALQRWGDHLEMLISGKREPAKVVALPRHKRT